MKVLATTRELLKFKDYTTIAEIAKFSGLSQQKVLEVINRNGRYVYRNRKNGRITRIDTRTPLIEQLWNSKKFYKKESYGAWSHEGYKLVLHKDLDNDFNHIKKSLRTGAIGDSWQITHIEDTPENRKILEDAGFKDWETRVVDDRLWMEEV